MDHVEIPDAQVIPMEAVAQGVQGLRITFVNVFSIANSNGSWILIDAGVPFSEPLIRSWAAKHFNSPPKAIVLTHGHFDHVSSAKELADKWGVPIFAHQLEFPYLTGEKEYPAPNAGSGGGLMSLLSPIYPRRPVDLGDRLRPFPSSETGLSRLVEMPDWEILHTPGHTPGHVSFFRPQDRTLLVGDAFCTTKPESFFEAVLLQQPELHGPSAYFTSDWDAARQSVQHLAELNPTVVAPGHGKPLSGPNVSESLRTLAAKFDAISLPSNAKS